MCIVLNFRTFLLDDKFCLNILELVEVVHHTYMLDNHTLGEAKTAAEIVAGAFHKIGNMQLDGENDGCDTLNKHIIMTALKYVCEMANNGSTSNQALIKKVLDILSDQDAETCLADIQWGSACWHAKYRRLFFREIANEVVKAYPRRFTLVEERQAEAMAGSL